MYSKKVVILHSINYATLKSPAAVGKPACCANISTVMKNIFSRFLILSAVTFVSFLAATQSAWGADAVVSGAVYANAAANYQPALFIQRAGSGEQCLDVTANSSATLSETFTDGTVLYSVDSDGRPITKENNGKFTSVKINNVATPCISDSRILVKFPVNVKTVTIYGYNKNDRTFSGVFISSTGAKSSYSEITYTGGTNSAVNPNHTFEITLSSEVADTVANKYLWFKFSNSISIYRICYTPIATIPHSVTYALDGGSGTVPTEAAKNAGVKFNLASADGITKEGYIFAGWNDGTTTYAAGAEYTMPDEDVTFTAQWTLAETPYTFHYGEKGNSYVSLNFTRVGTTNEWHITDFVFPDVNNNQVCYVGKGGYWYNSSLGENNAKSADLYFSDMPLALLQNTDCATKTLGWDKNSSNGHKAIGTLRIYDNYSDDNLYVGFIPNGYGMMHGANVGTWTSFAFASDAGGTVWTTDLVTLTAEMLGDAYKYYVGLLTSDGDYTYCGNSETSVLNTMGSFANSTWGGDLSTFSAGQKGVFRIWANSCNGNDTKNFVCHFLPYYHLTYNANYPAGASGQPADTQTEDYSAESSNTITLPAAPAAPAGYTFKGWYDAATDGTLIGAAGDDYTFNQPSANTILYAQWEVAPTCTDIAAATITSGDASNMTASIGAVYVDGGQASDGYLKLSGDARYIQLTAATGQAPFAAGDVLYVTCYNKNSSAANLGFKIKTTTCTLSITAKSESEIECTLTADAIESDGTIKLQRTSSEDRYKSVRVERCSSTPTLPACETPSITTQPVSATYCARETIAALSVEASVSDGGALSYQWQKDGADISGATKATYTPKEAGTYTCVVTNTLANHTPASVTSNEAVITINAAPAIKTQPASVSVTVKNSATLTVVATDATAYQWYTCDNSAGDNPIEISGAKAATYTVTPDALGTIYYKVIVTGTCGTATSDVVSITATDGPCFSMDITATSGSINGQTPLTASHATITGGMVLYDRANTESMDFSGDGIKFNSNSDYLKVTLSEGVVLAQGTQIKVTYTIGSDNRGIKILQSDKATEICSFSNTKGSYTETFTITSSMSENVFYITRVGSTAYLKSIEIQGCGKMCINPQLAWSAETVDGILGLDGTFSFPTLSSNPNSLSTINYDSSDKAVATIDGSGNVTILTAGTTTISATYEGDKDYCAQTVSYTLTVRCAVAPKITVEGGVNAECYETVVLRAVRSDDGNAYTTGSFLWYKDDVALPGETGVTLTTTDAGTYTVAYIADGGCEEMSVNSAKVTSTVVKPVVEKKAPHRNYQIKDRTTTEGKSLRPYTSTTHYPLFDVTPTPTNVYAGQTWKPSYTIHKAGTGTITAGDADIDWVRVDTTSGSTISLGANYEALGMWLSKKGFSDANVGDTIMLTMRAVNACNQPDDATADSIAIILTDKYSLAYIVTGNTTTRKFYDITASDITDPLYTHLCTKYNVTPVSAYATYDYTNYEPYDLLLLTDYPKATGSNSQPDYVNALADLVDKKPILSLKAHMSALSNWSAKGFTSNPIVPGDGTEAQAQKTLTVLCFSHDMFEGAEWDNKEDRTLTILGNVYQDGSTHKGIQGFLAINSSNFVNIAKVYDEKGARNLVACCERQDVTKARFIMLSINQGATKYINDKGQDAIDKLLKYLLWTDAANVSDCSLTFDNGEGDCKDCSDGKREFTVNGTLYTSGDHLWSNPANWNAKAIPTQLQNVRIEANCIVSGNTYGAGNVRIKEGDTLTIAPDGGLASVGQFAWYSDKNWNKPQPITSTNYITVQADANKTGMLMHSHTDQVAATVQMYSPAFYTGELTNGSERNWTYVGIPVQAGTVPEIFNGAYTYLWSEKDGWTRYKDDSTFHAFDGIALSQPSPQVFTFAGNLALAKKYTFTLTNGGAMGGMNLIGNSWTAPIQITKLEAADFGTGLEATVYIYSTGRDPAEGPDTTKSNGALAAGYWTAIPVATAKTSVWTGPRIIPAMQAFEVNFAADATATTATLTLDYNTIVRASGVDYSTLNQKLYAPGRNSTAEILQPDPSAPAPYEPTMLRIRVADTAACYNLYLLQGERFSEGFDNGWDGFYSGTDGRAPGLCALTTAGEMQVSAQPEINNTTLVFTQGKSDTYTFSFCLTESEDEPLAEPLYLNDMQLRKSCLIDDSRTYTFQSSESDMDNRFVISHIAFEEQDTPTGIANLATVDQQLLLNNPAREMLTIRVYDPAGKLCSEQQTDAPLLQLSLPTTQGVYMLYITGEHTQILRKAVQ